MRHVGDSERRTRLARRHAIAPDHRVADVESAARAVVAFHATDPASVYLQALARGDGVGFDAVDRALYDTRTLVKQLAMRRTLFAFPRDLLGAAVASAGRRVAAAEQARLTKEVVAGGLAADAAAARALVAAAEDAVVRRLADGSALTTRELGTQVTELGGRVLQGAGTKWESSDPLGPKVLTLLGARGRIVRGPNELGWHAPRYRWSGMEGWLGGPLDDDPTEAGWAELTRRWLRQYGPGTEADLVWWLGATKTIVRQALSDVGAVAVALDGEQAAYLLPDDLEPEPPVEPWAALLPTLDPTTMGWRGRDFYLTPDLVPHLFDRAGNAGPTAWWDGRIVGTWGQDDSGVVDVVPLTRLPAAARRALDAEASRLTDWLDGHVVRRLFSPQVAGRPRPAGRRTPSGA